ncbi:MAG: methyltransferase domain-containing protein [Clostridia bacterium]|nr:methyltransferase domain-containing protein [Clostridia bacterium]
MNVIWSKYVQGIKTLYCSRKLRFDDIFAAQYKSFFNLDESKPLKILEIGCGPGALASALHRWYPNAEITAIDRDSEFIKFAKENESGISFLEGDATALPFDDNTFDVTISNTVSEHIEPSRFYGEQYRVLKQTGTCFVLSSRKGINIRPDCFAYDEFEKSFWEKVNQFDNSMQEYSVCQYPMSESQLPLAMQQYGFQSVATGYATIDLTPDDPKYSAEMAHNMINTIRYSAIESLETVLNTMPEHTSVQEISKMKEITNQRFDSRIRDYNLGKKYWETNLSIIMMIRGTKQ